MGFKQESEWRAGGKYEWQVSETQHSLMKASPWIHTTEHTSHVHARHKGTQAQTPKVLSVTWHALNPTCVQTHTAAHLSYCCHLPGLLSNSTHPQIVYRACNIVHLRGNVRRRQMTQSPSMETGKQDGGGTVAARSTCVHRQFRRSGDEGRLREMRANGSPSVSGFGHTRNQHHALISICPQGQGDKNVFSISFIVTGSLMPSEKPPVWLMRGDRNIADDCESSKSEIWVCFHSHDGVDSWDLLEHVQTATHQEGSSSRRVGQHAPDHRAVWKHHKCTGKHTKKFNFSPSTRSLRRHTLTLLHRRKASHSWFVKVL